MILQCLKSYRAGKSSRHCHCEGSNIFHKNPIEPCIESDIDMNEIISANANDLVILCHCVNLKEDWRLF